jgi:hypothetical protein
MQSIPSPEDTPRWTNGLCYICGKLVQINAQDKTKGQVVTYGKKIGFEHNACVKKIITEKVE